MIFLFKKARGRFGLLIAVATSMAMFIILYKHGSIRLTFNVYTNTNTENSNEATRGVAQNMVTRVGFLKVRKAGSTTLTTLLFRFAADHNLRAVVPKETQYVNSRDNIIPINGSFKFDIFAVHTNYYNETFFDELLTKDRKDIAIIREPLSRMISAAYYYRNQQEYLRKFPETDYIHHLLMSDVSKCSFTMNSMGADFGFCKHASESEEDVKKYLEYLNTRFALVLIMERLDESLVLLKRMLNWSLKDVLYSKKNINKQYDRDQTFNETELSNFRKRSFLDYEIYEYFLWKFQQKIEAENDIAGEVMYFTKLLFTVGDFCSDIETINHGTTLHVMSKIWNEDFYVDENDCIKIAKANEIVRKKLKKSHAES